MPTTKLLRTASLPYVLSLPDERKETHPLLCFLHGYDEGAPAPMPESMQRNGPLAPESHPGARTTFIIVAPQLPRRGDLWFVFADDVREIIDQVASKHLVDRKRMYLTGFSFGGNGVFDLALEQRDLWAALWPVDPPRCPAVEPGQPVWFSSGEVSRPNEMVFRWRLRLSPLEGNKPGSHTYVDDNEDHVGTARKAYGDARIYEWLLRYSLY